MYRALGCLVLLVIVGAIAYGLAPYVLSRTWRTLGGIQVLEGPTETWIFLDVEEMDGSLFFGMRTKIHQEVIAVAAGAIKSRGRFAGPLVSPNLGRVVHFQGKFYMCVTGGDVYELEPLTGFRRLAPAEAQAFFDGTGLGKANSLSALEAMAAELQSQEGWATTFSQAASPFGFDVVSRDGNYRFYYDRENQIETIYVEQIHDKLQQALVSVDTRRIYTWNLSK